MVVTALFIKSKKYVLTDQPLENPLRELFFLLIQHIETG